MSTSLDDPGLIRVARVVCAVDGGRILNEKTARSQIIGGAVGGIGTQSTPTFPISMSFSPARPIR
jgi:CO/xanthine dehydrogenase Mo-binding subunit